jgi:hypothetical protein
VPPGDTVTMKSVQACSTALAASSDTISEVSSSSCGRCQARHACLTRLRAAPTEAGPRHGGEHAWLRAAPGHLGRTGALPGAGAARCRVVWDPPPIESFLCRTPRSPTLAACRLARAAARPLMGPAAA